MDGDQPRGAVARIEPEDERIEHAIIRAAQDDSIDIGKLQALLDMQRSVQHERSVRMFNVAMAQAQAEMMPVIRDAVNKHTNSRYARLATIDAQMRPIYTRYGFSVRFGSQPSPKEGWMRVTCLVAHAGGHYEELYLDAPPDDVGVRGAATKTAVQSVGSSVSYLRRYLLTMAFNIVLADEIDPDTDGENGRRSRAPEPPAEPDPLAPLQEQNGPRWLTNLRTLLASATSENDVTAIGGHGSVNKTLSNPQTPSAVRKTINNLLYEAHQRFVAKPPDEISRDWNDDELEGMLAEIETMDAITLAGLDDNAQWRTKVRDLFPPDRERVDEAVAARKAKLAVRKEL
jgi:ERF superfamily